MSPQKRLPNLTSLRFFLACLVILFHLPEFCKKRGFPYYDDLAIFHKGVEAVNVFFVLSGFLIVRNLAIEKISTGNINLKLFYKKRMLRILPVYYLILLIGFFYYQYFITLFGFAQEVNYNFWEGFLLGITFFANILATYHPGGIIEVLWSIAIEEQFYLFIAPILLLINNRKIIVFLACFTFIYFFVYHLPAMLLLRHYKMLFFYLSAGGIFGYISLYKRTIKYKYLLSTISYLLFIFIFLTNLLDKIFNDFLQDLFCVIVFSSTIFFLSIKPYQLFEGKYLNYLGKISYGIYMYHAIVFQVVGYFFLQFNLHSPTLFIILFNVFVFGLTIIIASLSYKFYESKFLKLN